MNIVVMEKLTDRISTLDSQGAVCKSTGNLTCPELLWISQLLTARILLATDSKEEHAKPPCSPEENQRKHPAAFIQWAKGKKRFLRGEGVGWRRARGGGSRSLSCH